MSKIDELIAEYCSDGMEYRKLGDVYKFQYGRGNTIPTVGGKYPVYGSNGVVGTHNEYNSEDSPVIGHIGAYAGIVNWGNGRHFVTYNGVICNLIANDVLARYAYFQLLNQDFLSLAHSGSQPFVSYSMLNKIEVAIPPLPVQKEIVNILDKFTALEAELEAELEARTHQYEYYRNELLTFESGTDVEWKALGDVCLKTNNIKWKENIGKDYNYIDLSAVNRDNNQIEGLQNITSENAPSRAQQIVQTNDIIYGTTRPTLKRYAIVRSDLDGHICSTGFCVLRPNQNLILPKFLFFILKSQLFFNYVENNQEGAGYPAISNTKVKNFQYPIPRLEEQERIVAILDKFDALVNDISVGLPAEIAARKQQYEYYRGKLLTFEPLAVAQ